MYKNNFFLILGLSLSLFTFFYYLKYDYSHIILILWILSLAVTSIHFFNFKVKPKEKGLDRLDLYIVLILIIIFSPIYLTSIYTVPYQINTDEILNISLSNSSYLSPNLLAISSYGHAPAFRLVIFRWYSEFLGGVDLIHMRSTQALFSLFIIGSSYIFFRIFISRLFAFSGAILFSTQHVFLAMSRMAIGDMQKVLIEIIAVAFLALALKRKCTFYTFLAGMTFGLSFYNHFPVGMVAIMFVFFIIIFFQFLNRQIDLVMLRKIILINILGIILVVLPLLANIIDKVHTDDTYYRKQLLIFPEGRGPNILESIKNNAMRGLTIFNNNIPDNGWIYPNPNHGFVDPLSGILIWIGVLILLVKSKKSEAEKLMLGSFFLILFTISFIVNKAPHYNRASVILPFAIFLTAEAIRSISIVTEKVFIKLFRNNSYLHKIGLTTFLILVSVIIIWNLMILKDFIDQGFGEGNYYGGGVRYVEARKNFPTYHFVLATNEQDPWKRTWVPHVTTRSQKFTLISPEALNPPNNTLINIKDPFTIFMSETVWQMTQKNLLEQYPNLKLHRIMPDGSLLAIEVL